MRDHSPLSPEERRKRLATMRAAFGTEVEEKLKPRLTAWEVVKRVAIGVYNDGFIHAGNLAYLSIVALFPSSSSLPPSRTCSGRARTRC